jgi:hypothetical protein
MGEPAQNRRPNILLVMTDQLHHPPAYESDELAAYRREHCAGQERLRANGVSFNHHYPISAACAPSRASLLTGHHPSLHGVSQTPGLTKSDDGDDMFWLAPDDVPTMGDWFRAGGYRTYYKGKWHASHAHLDADDGDGYLLSIDDDGKPQEENIKRYLVDPLPAAECKYGVSFVGAAYGRRREVVDALQARDVSVECFGDGWPNGPVAAEDIPCIFQSSRISLNFSDAYKENTPRQIKARTFEVPGAGGLLLTESAPGLERFYELGSEIVSCRNLDEMVMQIRRLEGNSQERDSTAWAGNIRTRAEHTYDHRLTEVLEFALAAHGRQPDRSRKVAFRNAVADHQVGTVLRQFKRVLRALCIAIWGADRGTRAARRAIFEFSWRILGERTFQSRGLPGRLFPEV